MLRPLRLLAFMLVAIIFISACGDSESPVTNVTGVKSLTSTTPADASRAVDQQFLLDLEAGFDATTWTEVQLAPQRGEEILIGYPESFAPGHYLSLEPMPGDPALELPKSIHFYVPAVEIPMPAGCIPFRIEGVPLGTQFIVRTFLPAWVDANDLGPCHVTYRLDEKDSGLAIASLKLANTPAAPWLTPPVSFVVTGWDPGRGDGVVDKWFADPGTGPNDD